MEKRILPLMFGFLLLVGCGQGSSDFSTPSSSDSNQQQGADPGLVPTPAPGVNPTPTPAPVANAMPVDESKIALDAFGENFQSTNARELRNSRYMQQNCTSVTSWSTWQNLPMVHCRYTTQGQTAEVLMLNAGPRRLTQWMEEACGTFAANFNTCMTKTFDQVIGASGGQFPVGGVVIEDMDGDGKGNAYAFRNGVTVAISAFASATESILTSTQIAASFTQSPLKSYTYGRPISVTREQMTAYAAHVGLSIPALGSTSGQSNTFNAVVGSWYQQAWFSSQNHLIRAWVYAQKF